MLFIAIIKVSNLINRFLSDIVTRFIKEVK